MSAIKLPDSFVVPREFRTDDLYIRKLCFDDVEADYAAVMSSIDVIERLRGRGNGWPDPAMTLAENHRDLGWHDKEFEDRSSFAYIAWSADATEYLGCIYFYRPGTRGEASANADVDLSYWVTAAAAERGYYEKLYQALQTWLKDWPFQTVVFTNDVIPQ